MKLFLSPNFNRFLLVANAAMAGYGYALGYMVLTLFLCVMVGLAWFVRCCIEEGEVRERQREAAETGAALDEIKMELNELRAESERSYARLTPPSGKLKGVGKVL